MREVMCVLDKVSSEINERFKQLMYFNDKLSFLLDTKSLLASRNNRDQLKKKCMVCAVAYTNYISINRLISTLRTAVLWCTCLMT